MTDTDLLAVLCFAKRLYERDHNSIMTVFDDAANTLDADEQTRFEAIRMFIISIPDPSDVFNIQDMLVSDLVEGFTRAVQSVEQRFE